MTGSYLIVRGTHENRYYEKRVGTIIRNSDMWFGIAREGPSDWVITELTTGLKACTQRLYRKADAEIKAKSKDFHDAVKGTFDCENSSLSYSQIEKIKQSFEKDRELCLAAYCDKRHDNEADLAKTCMKIFRG